MSDPSRTERRLLASIRTAKAGGEAGAAEPTFELKASEALPTRQASSKAPGGRSPETTASKGVTKATGRSGEPASGPARNYQSGGRVWPD
jgi:hypothetical protein